MANNPNKVNALLEEIKSESQILANAIKRQDAALAKEDYRTYYLEQLFIHKLENQYRGESGKVLDQAYSEIALKFGQQIPSPHTAKITKEAIERGREQAKNDAIFKMTYRPQVEASLKTRGWDITTPKMKLMIEKFVDKGLLHEKLKNRQEQIDQMAKQRPQSAPLPQTQTKHTAPLPQTQKQIQQVIKPVVTREVRSNARLIAVPQRRNERARQQSAQQLAQQKVNNQGLIGHASSNTAQQQLTRSQSQTNFYQTFNQQQLTRSQSQTSLYPTLQPQQQLTRSQSQITSNPYDDIFKQSFPHGVKMTSQENIRPQSALANNKFNGYPSFER